MREEETVRRGDQGDRGREWYSEGEVEEREREKQRERERARGMDVETRTGNRGRNASKCLAHIILGR